MNSMAEILEFAKKAKLLHSGGGSEAVWKFSENSLNLVQVMLPKDGLLLLLEAFGPV